MVVVLTPKTRVIKLHSILYNTSVFELVAMVTFFNYYGTPQHTLCDSVLYSYVPERLYRMGKEFEVADLSRVGLVRMILRAQVIPKFIFISRTVGSANNNMLSIVEQLV